MDHDDDDQVRRQKQEAEKGRRQRRNAGSSCVWLLPSASCSCLLLRRDRSLHADAYLYFALKPDGSIDNMKMQAVSPLTDFSFDFQDLLFVPAKL